jgi:hypothetical protein
MSTNYDVVAVIGQSMWRHFLPMFCAELKARHNSRVILYCGSSIHKEHFEKNNPDGVYSEIKTFPLETPATLSQVVDVDDLVKRATAVEQKYGRTINSLTVNNAHLGRGYALGGLHHPKSVVSENCSYEQMLDIYVDQVDYWEKELLENGITLVVNQKNAVGAMVAHHHKVNVRNIFEARYKSFSNWAVDDMMHCPQIEEQFLEIEDDVIEDTFSEITAPPKGHAVVRRSTMKQFTVLGTLQAVLVQLKQRAYKFYKRDNSAPYYLNSVVGYAFRRWLEGRRLIGRNFPTLAEIEGVRYVYFPLHVEPETSVQGQSPEFFCQLWAIACLAKNLPADVRLVVKEHLGAVGRRPRDFYNQILAFKNVIFLDVRELGKDVVGKAAVVSTISGTAGLEAAVIGKPVLSFGHHNGYGIVPHVQVAFDEPDVCRLLKEMLSVDFDTTQARTEGAKYIKAVEAASFDLPNYNHLTAEGIDANEVATVVDALEKSFVGQNSTAENSV